MEGFVGYLKRHHVALLALFIALGGVSYAAVNLPKNSVGSKQIAKNAVRSGEIKNGAVGGLELGKVLTSRVRTSSAQQISTITPSNVTFGQVVENAGKFANLGSSPTALRAPRPGVYLLQAELRWFNLPGSGRVGGNIQVRRSDGSNLRPAAGAWAPAGNVQFLLQPISAIERLQSGQQVGLNVYQDTGGTVQLDNTDQGAWLSMAYLGK